MTKKVNKNKPVDLIFFFIFWIVALIIGFILGGIQIAMGLGIAGVISAIIYYTSANSEYSGVIVDFKIRKYQDHDGIYREEKKAILKLGNGKTKKLSPMHDWKIGDRIVKTKGETTPRVID